MTTATDCIPNIGPRQRRRRVTFGVVLALVAVGAFAALLAGDAGRWWRLALFVPLYGAGLGAFQAYERTCVGLAARKQRNLDTGYEAITDAGELARVQAQARRVRVEALAAAIVLTVAAMVV